LKREKHLVNMLCKLGINANDVYILTVEQVKIIAQKS
jgi:hypothetical protein